MQEWAELCHMTFYLKTFAPNLKIPWRKSPNESTVYLLNTASKFSICFTHIKEVKCCSPRRHCWGWISTGRVWPAGTPHQLHILCFLSEQQIWVLYWKLILFNGEKIKGTKLRFAHRTLRYHLPLSFYTWIFFSEKPF